MKAKDLFGHGANLNEAAEGEGQSLGSNPPPPGATSGPRTRPMRPRGDRPMPFDPSQAQPPRMFSTQELSALKDVLLLIATEAAGNDFDGAIARKLMAGGDLNPGELQHVLDEAGRIRDLPESHRKLLQKIFDLSTQRPR